MGIYSKEDSRFEQKLKPQVTGNIVMPATLESDSDQDDPFKVMKRQAKGQLGTEIQVTSNTGSLEHTLANNENQVQVRHIQPKAVEI